MLGCVLESGGGSFGNAAEKGSEPGKVWPLCKSS